MEDRALLELGTEIGYLFQRYGAETYRVEESIVRLLDAYGVNCEVFAIPSSLIVSITTASGEPLTRLRRIGFHKTDLDAVERLNALCRLLCSQTPPPKDAMHMLRQTEREIKTYPFSIMLVGYFLVASGFSVFFGGRLLDAVCAGLCGIATGLCLHKLEALYVNEFFSTIAAGFTPALLTQLLSLAGLVQNADAVTIGALMLLVPGLLITSCMRDIIYGDTMSGVNRLIQAVLCGVAIALGTGAALTLSRNLLHISAMGGIASPSFVVQGLAVFVGCAGFCLLYNIRGLVGIAVCAIGGVLSWSGYTLAISLGLSEMASFFAAAALSSFYAEVMARVRKYPAISYLITALLPLVPGAGIYYTVEYALSRDMNAFLNKGLETVGIAGVLAVGILLVSSLFRMHLIHKRRVAQTRIHSQRNHR